MGASICNHSRPYSVQCYYPLFIFNILNGPCYSGPAFISPSPSRWTLHGMSRHIKEVLSVKQFRVDWSRTSRHLPASVSHNDRRKVQTFVTLYSTPYAGYYAGPWSMSTIKSQPMVSARLSASATKKPVVCRPMAILYPPSMLFFFFFFSPTIYSSPSLPACSY